MDPWTALQRAEIEFESVMLAIGAAGMNHATVEYATEPGMERVVNHPMVAIGKIVTIGTRRIRARIVFSPPDIQVWVTAYLEPLPDTNLLFPPIISLQFDAMRLCWETGIGDLDRATDRDATLTCEIAARFPDRKIPNSLQAHALVEEIVRFFLANP